MPFTRNTTIYSGMGKDIVSMEKTKRSMLIDAKIAAFNKRLEQIQERNRANIMLSQKVAEAGMGLAEHGRELQYQERGAKALGVDVPKPSWWDLTKTAFVGPDKGKMYKGAKGEPYSGRELAWVGAGYNFGDEYGRLMAMNARKNAFTNMRGTDTGLSDTSTQGVVGKKPTLDMPWSYKK